MILLVQLLQIHSNCRSRICLGNTIHNILITQRSTLPQVLGVVAVAFPSPHPSPHLQTITLPLHVLLIVSAVSIPPFCSTPPFPDSLWIRDEMTIHHVDSPPKTFFERKDIPLNNRMTIQQTVLLFM